MGAVLLVFGGLVVMGALDSGQLDGKALTSVAPAGFMTLAGLGMVFKARGGLRWILLLAAVLVAAGFGRALRSL